MTSSPRRFKTVIYENFARIGKSLASPRRLELLDLLAQSPRTVEALAREAGLSVANTSRHLQVLRGAGLVEAEKQGFFVTYRLAGSEVDAFARALRDLAEARLAEVERTRRAFFASREEMEPIDREALLQRVREGRVTVLDVRPADEYRAGHIAGAISIPLGDLPRRLSDLPRERDIVAYCRGPYCVLALQAVELLRTKGYHATRLGDSVGDWRARGYDVASGAGPT